jgi:hypothetical protein
MPSSSTITPCGADPAPSLIARTSPLAGSSQPSSPLPCAVYQTPPSAAGATSCGRDPAGSGYVAISKVGSAADAAGTALALGSRVGEAIGAVDADDGLGVGTTVGGSVAGEQPQSSPVTNAVPRTTFMPRFCGMAVVMASR